MKTISKGILAFGLCLYAEASFGHDQQVHFAITQNAAASAYAYSSGYADFVNMISSDISYSGPNGVTASMTLGSWLEDNAPEPIDEGGYRSINHFYDPLDATYSKGLSDIPPDVRKLIAANSFMWGSVSNCLGLHVVEGVTSNRWSWPNARGYEWLGLTATNQSDRQKNLANMFQAVGQVMHLLEDTSQPQHVRNEQHLDKLPGILSIIPSPWYSCIEDFYKTHSLNYQHGMLDWRGDGFKKLEDFWDRHSYNGNSAALYADLNGGADTLGLAEYCNGNFLGVRHT